MEKRLKIGLLLDSYTVPRWQFTTIERLQKSSYIDDILIILQNNKEKKANSNGKNWKFLLYNLYSRLDRKLFDVDPNGLKQENFKDLINTKKVLSLNNTKSDQKGLDKIKKYNPDVLIKFGSQLQNRELAKMANYGIWYYSESIGNSNGKIDKNFWEVMNNSEATSIALKIQTEAEERGKILFQSKFPTDKRSVYRNQNTYWWRAVSILLSKLEELYKIGGDKFLKKLENKNGSDNYEYTNLSNGQQISNWKISKLLASQFFKYLKDKLNKSLFIEQWFLLFGIDNKRKSNFSEFKKILPPGNKFYADPFAVKEKDRYYIFLEDFIYQTNKGHISVIEVDHDGNYKEPVKVIDRPYHLAYPFIFKYKGDYYMIPDSRSNRTIELYKCEKFPYDWQFLMNLMEDVEAVDTTLYYHHDYWWLFTNIKNEFGNSSYDELYLFYSRNPFTKEWQAHPANPVVSDVNRSRPAGRIFKKDDKIIRPSQICTPSYGYGINFNEIKVLNKYEYEETIVKSIEPKWSKQLNGVHTYNKSGNMTVIDGMIKKRRL